MFLVEGCFCSAIGDFSIDKHSKVHTQMMLSLLAFDIIKQIRSFKTFFITHHDIIEILYFSHRKILHLKSGNIGISFPWKGLCFFSETAKLTQKNLCFDFMELRME